MASAKKHGSLERKAWGVSLVVSVVAVTLIALSSRSMLPEPLVPPASDWLVSTIPHINAVLVLTAFVTVVLGYRAIQDGRVSDHARYMMVTTVLFFVFLAFYLVRLANIGTTEFGGSEFVYSYVYLPFLGIHMLLAIICIPLVLYAAIIGVSLDVSEIRKTAHPRVGRVATPLWAVSFLFGFVVYLMLHHIF
ncbi:DUF420 domain-containing protein [Halorutilales archaeon Cl-col2-1]